MSMNRQSTGLTVALLFLWIAAVWAAGSTESPDAGISEPADLAVCEKNSDCIVVPYSHCCGSTRRAINRRYEVEYSKHKEWQSFNDPEQCALMGALLRNIKGLPLLVLRVLNFVASVNRAAR